MRYFADPGILRAQLEPPLIVARVEPCGICGSQVHFQVMGFAKDLWEMNT